MTDSVDHLILDLIEWLRAGDRTYPSTMDAWRTSCPRLQVWEDAVERGLVEIVSVEGRSMVRATSAGAELHARKRPQRATPG